MNQFKTGNLAIVNLGTKAAKLARKAYPGQEETANRHAIEAFVCLCLGAGASAGVAEARLFHTGHCHGHCSEDLVFIKQ